MNAILEEEMERTRNYQRPHVELFAIDPQRVYADPARENAVRKIVFGTPAFSHERRYTSPN